MTKSSLVSVRNHARRVQELKFDPDKIEDSLKMPLRMRKEWRGCDPNISEYRVYVLQWVGKDKVSAEVSLRPFIDDETAFPIQYAFKARIDFHSPHCSFVKSFPIKGLRYDCSAVTISFVDGSEFRMSTRSIWELCSKENQLLVGENLIITNLTPAEAD